MPQDNTAFGSLALFSFGGDIAPVEKYDLVGGIRDFVHEYSHQDGGDPELLGRRLYTVHCQINFASAKYRRYPGLWPRTINRMMQRFELGEVHDLVLPTVGTIQAYAYAWTRTMTARLRSGEMMSVEFREASTNLPLAITATYPSPPSLTQSSASLSAALAQNNADPQAQTLGNSLQTLVASIVAISDTASLAGNALAQRIQQAANICGQLDGATSLQDPSNAAIVQALHALWAQLVQYKNDVLSRKTTLQTYVTPRRMPMSAVSSAIYGDTTHTGELLALNTGAYADPADIPQGTALVYYPNTPST